MSDIRAVTFLVVIAVVSVGATTTRGEQIPRRFWIEAPQVFASWYLTTPEGASDSKQWADMVGLELGWKLELDRFHLFILSTELGMGGSSVSIISSSGHDDDLKLHGERSLMGLGIGYGFLIDLYADVVLLEVAATVGYHHAGSSEYFDDSGEVVHDDYFVIGNLRPRLHIGWGVVYLSLGPTLGFGNRLILGCTAGLGFRI